MCPTTSTRASSCSARTNRTARRGSAGEVAARAILETRGSTPRLYRNTLAFLVADRTRLQDLDEAARRFLAWQSIVEDANALDLTPQQVRQAETQKAAADGAVTARLPETYQWLLVPEQRSPQAPITWQPVRLTGSDDLAVRASKKLKTDELLLTGFAATRLRMELDRVPLWRGDHVSVRQLADDFARYLYLPRLKDSSVLVRAVSEGVSLLTWESDSYAFADSMDEAAGRYRGLRAATQLSLGDADTSGMLVKSDVARRQMDAERPASPTEGSDEKPRPGESGGKGGGEGVGPPPPPPPRQPKRYHGTVTLDTTRVGRDASRIADEVIAHLAGLVGARVTVTLEVEAEMPGGAPEKVVRTVTENGRTLKFASHGFEEE